jgi:predicted Zn-ribbon and HTH transcriptional regulator
MITLAPATAFLLYLALSLALLLILSLRHAAQARRRRAIPPEYSAVQCEYCSERYLAESGRSFSRCPQCKSLGAS